MPSHGLVLNDEHCNPESLTEFGQITISDNRIEIKGFESADASTCRQMAAQALAWGIDMLRAELLAVKACPGAGCSVID
jgi:hypothetical protein